MTPNCAPAIECHYAIAGWAGCVALNLNPRLSPDELAYCLEGADCEVLVADTSYAGLVVEASRRYEKIRAVVWTDVLHKAAADLDVPTVLYETVVADGPVVERPEDAKALPGSAARRCPRRARDGSNVPTVEKPLEADADAVDVAPGSDGVGEVWIRGPTLFSGYNNNAKATAEAITPDGWFRTGDLAKVNDMSYLTITDRAKDMILVGSENVYCVEAVVVKQDDSLTAAALRRHAAAKLADFKVPSSIEFVARADLPMTGSGKVAKAALKKRDAKLAEERKAARASRKQAAQPPSGIADHVYGVTWVDAPLAAEAAAAVEGFWVLLDDGTGVAQELAAKMTGATAAILPPAPAGATLEQEKARVACALEESGEDVAGVVCLTALGAGAALGDDVAGATKAALKTLLALLQALDERDDAPRVVVATRGAADDASLDGVEATAPDAALASCAVWGMVRSAAAETPKLRFRVVDLCPCEPSRERDAAFLLQELGTAPPASRAESAWRKRRRKAPRLAPLPVPRLLEGGPVVDADVAAGVHVVSGGTGGLGVEWAGKLAAAAGKAATLVLASRRAPSPELAAKLAKLASDTGATVVVEQADVSLASGAEALLARGAALKPTPATKLRVWHLAGVVDDGARRR
ncbi:ligase [Aureococcus anophagefferens]|uniref:Ligase n=1 Tax=Aureococcus anophagefferens TaxID=44056 RepID=A0ABR1G833_AURAN